MHYVRRYLIDPSVGVQMDGAAIHTRNALNMNAKEILTARKIKHVLRTSVVTLAKRFCVAIEQHAK
jgi:hypothetical protein